MRPGPPLPAGEPRSKKDTTKPRPRQAKPPALEKTEDIARETCQKQAGARGCYLYVTISQPMVKSKHKLLPGAAGEAAPRLAAR